MIVHLGLTFAVIPVLIGPLQTLLALLPAILLGVGSLVFAAFKPAGFKKLVKFCWRQRFFLGFVGAIAFVFYQGIPQRLLHGRGHLSTVQGVGDSQFGLAWPAFQGGSDRTGRNKISGDPTVATLNWTSSVHKTIYSSPAIVGNRILFSTVSGIGPFTPLGRGAIVCVDAHTGDEIWRHAPTDYRATFSSPVVHDGLVVCGEGLHQVQDARITCLDFDGRLMWEFPTSSHVEATACIDDGRVFIGAGDDGFYCLELRPFSPGPPNTTNVRWHLDGDKYPDCESSPIVVDGVVYFGLGDGGRAVCAVDSATGKPRWKVETPYPVYAPPAVARGKLYVAMGNGNFVQSAADLLEAELQQRRDDGATVQQLALAKERLGPAGEVWCIDLATQNVDWRFKTNDTVLGAVAVGEHGIYFGSRDHHFYSISLDGELLHRFDSHEPIVASPALGEQHVFCVTISGRLYCLDLRTLKPVWDMGLGSGHGFMSSPALAHGHVYVGTAQNGLRCIGAPGLPQVPSWTQGERGGSADDEPIPESLSIAWRFPSDDEARLTVTAPLMPLDRSLYVACRRGDQSEFIRLDVEPSREDAARKEWSCRFAGLLATPPAGRGDRLYMLESPAPGTSSKGALHCLSTSDGRTLWNRPVDAVGTGGIALDAERVFAWTRGSYFSCLNAESGAVLWESACEPGIGAPILTDQIVVAASAGHLSAWDAPSGKPLWRVSLNEIPTGGPTIHENYVSVPYGSKRELFYIGDGGLVRTEPVFAASSPWRNVDGLGTPVTPFVTLKGRVYVANAEGAVVCLAAEAP